MVSHWYIPSCLTNPGQLKPHHFAALARYFAGALSYKYNYCGPCSCQVHTYYHLINAIGNACTVSTHALTVKRASDQVLWQWSRSCRSWTLLGTRVRKAASACPRSLGGNFLTLFQTWQKAADWGSENAFIVVRLQTLLKMNCITKPYKYSSSLNLPDFAWLVLNNLVALIKSLWVAGAFVYEVTCWIPDEFVSVKLLKMLTFLSTYAVYLLVYAIRFI